MRVSWNNRAAGIASGYLSAYCDNLVTVILLGMAMRIFNILMISSALVVLGTEALAGDLVINPFPVAPKAESQPSQPAQSINSPMQKSVSNLEKGAPLSVSASELMELDPDIVTEPLGRAVSEPQPEDLLPPLEVQDAVSAPQALEPNAAPQSLGEASFAPAPELSSQAPPDVQMPERGALVQKRPGLVYIRNGQILKDLDVPSSAQVGEVIWSSAPATQAAPSVSPAWQAQAGEEVRSVLARWSAQAGVDFVWDSPENFVALSPVLGGDSYESSVQALLDQYMNSATRPVAQLYKNPQTSAPVLVVRLSDKI
jgi:hypothetical protein